jgi:hypothetical protein
MAGRRLVLEVLLREGGRRAGRRDHGRVPVPVVVRVPVGVVRVGVRVLHSCKKKATRSFDSLSFYARRARARAPGGERRSIGARSTLECGARTTRRGKRLGRERERAKCLFRRRRWLWEGETNACARPIDCLLMQSVESESVLCECVCEEGSIVCLGALRERERLLFKLLLFLPSKRPLSSCVIPNQKSQSNAPHCSSQPHAPHRTHITVEPTRALPPQPRRDCSAHTRRPQKTNFHSRASSHTH